MQPNGGNSQPNQGNPNVNPKPNDNAQGGLGQEFQDILNGNNNGQGNGNNIPVPTIVQGGGGGSENIPTPTLVQGGGSSVPTLSPIAPTADVHAQPTPVDSDAPGAEFGLDVIIFCECIF